MSNLVKLLTTLGPVAEGEVPTEQPKNEIIYPTPTPTSQETMQEEAKPESKKKVKVERVKAPIIKEEVPATIKEETTTPVKEEVPAPAPVEAPPQLIKFDTIASLVKQSQEKTPICLCMIVKNENHVIERSLNSAAPFITTYVICDTGSTDNTKELIKKTMDKHGIQGLIIDSPWVNFGHNRSVALEEARKHTDGKGWSWMLDADDSLEGKPMPDAFWKSVAPNINAFRVRIHHGNIKHQRTQVFSNKKKWTFKGAVHEWPALAEGEGDEVQAMMPDHVWHTARCEGSRSADPLKYVRDALALRAELQKTPNEPRAAFYMAQSFRDAGLLEEAKLAYKKRIEIETGWAQEKYMSIVNLIKMAPTVDEKIELCWKALQIDSDRLEAPYYTLHAARTMNKFSQQAYALACVVENREPRDSFLFPEPDVYNWQYDDEVAVIAYWMNHDKKSADAALRAVQNGPAYAKERLQKNVDFALERMKKKRIAAGKPA